MGTGAQVLLLAATALPPFAQVESPDALGVPTWHHNASLAAVVLASAILWRPMTRDRRFLGVGVLVTTLLALASAFLILYLKDWLKATYLKDWAKFWHVAWSWASISFFLGHTWANRQGMARAWRRMSAGVNGIGLYAAMALVVVAIPLTWSPWGARAITDPNYIGLTLYTWLGFLVPTYGMWLVATLRQRATGIRPAWWSRAGTQNFTDTWLLNMTVLANVTGFPLLYFGTKDMDIKYVAKYWHTWPSIAMAILVFAHTLHFLPGITRHLRARKEA
jgi:hypothetical protein